MFRSLRDWFDNRTGLGYVVDALLLEHIPGGAKWRYVWGSALMFVFTLQFVTGLLLMTAYSPSDTTAWGSVYFIQYEMDFGWLIRGLHHFGSQLMVILLCVHMLQVVIAGAHLKPREVNWWLGLALAGVTLALSLTGYLLPWDQKGYYATQVATNIAGNTPVVGDLVQKTVVGGPEYGHHTLTRFFSLHVGVLPLLMIGLIAAHIWVFRRHGVTHPKNPVGAGWFWPDQVFKDMIISMILFAILLGLVLYGWGSKVPTDPDRSTYDRIAHAGKSGMGANLDAPADPDSPYPARPEWYFLALFQLLKFFQGDMFLVGTLVIPGAIALVLFLLPFFGYGKLRKVGHFFAVLFVFALFGGIAFLTIQAWVEDQKPEDLEKQPYALLKKTSGSRYDPEAGHAHQIEIEEADKKAQRAIQLAGDGIPREGARYLLRWDPMTKGKALFKAECASCHNYRDGESAMNAAATAADLTDFGTKAWITGILKEPESPIYFGATHLKDGKMVKWVKGQWAKADNDEKKKKLESDFEIIADWLSQHPRTAAPDDDKSPFTIGRNKFEEYCAECHTYRPKPGEEAADGPDLTGYGDADWLRKMLVSPADPTRYGSNNRMPGYRSLSGPGSEIALEQLARERALRLKDLEDPGDDDAKKKEHEDKVKEIEAPHRINDMSDLNRELIIRFLMKDGRIVLMGETISAPPEKPAR